MSSNETILIPLPKSDPSELATRMERARQHALGKDGNASVLKKREEAKKGWKKHSARKKSSSNTSASRSGDGGNAATATKKSLQDHNDQYYAVRVGCYYHDSIEIDIRSAIFFHWEDAQKFLLDENDDEAPDTEYEAFSCVQEAVDYLKEGEQQSNQVASSSAAAAGRTSIEKQKLSTQKKRRPLPLTKSNNSKATAAKRKSPASAESKSKEQLNKKQKVDTSSEESGGEEKDPPKSGFMEYNDWDKMFIKALEYKKAHNGSIDIPEKEKGSILLRRWLKTQCQEYHNYDSLTTHEIEKLGTELGVSLPPSWEEMHDRLVAHRAAMGTLDLTKDDDDEELFEWTKIQKRSLVQHLQGKSTKLCMEKLRTLQSLGYAPSRPGNTQANGIHDSIAAEQKWNTMLQQLCEYKERNNGSISFAERATLSEHEKALSYWVADQRKEFQLLKKNKPSTLTAQRMQRLAAVGFDLTPTFEYVSWSQRMEQLQKFVEEHGHCKVGVSHPELGNFVCGIRGMYKDWVAGRERTSKGKRVTLTEERVNELTELGFVFAAGKSPIRKSTKKYSWDDRFQQLLEFKEEHGHTVVPQLSGPLGDWVRLQRVNYKKYKAGRSSGMTAEKALRLAEIGFCFDASARFGKKDKDED